MTVYHKEISIQTKHELDILDITDEIKKVQESEKIFTELSVIFKDDTTEIWMNSDLVEIEKPELAKKVERNLKKVTHEYRKGEEYGI